jgi:hypothetical protein
MRVIAVIDDSRVVEKILRHLGFWHDPAAGPSPSGAPGPHTYEPCDGVDPTPDYENVLTDCGACAALASSPHGECGQKPILPHPRSVNNRRGGKKAISYRSVLLPPPLKAVKPNTIERLLACWSVN